MAIKNTKLTIIAVHNEPPYFSRKPTLLYNLFITLKILSFIYFICIINKFILIYLVYMLNFDINLTIWPGGPFQDDCIVITVPCNIYIIAAIIPTTFPNISFILIKMN